MEKNLLQKLSEKFGKNCHNATIKIVKGVTALMVATAIATSSLASCTFLPEIPGIIDKENPNKDLVEKPYVDVVDFLFNSSSRNRDVDIEPFSQVLQTALTDPEIRNNWEKEMKNIGLCKFIPYTFLESKGFDVEKIKTGEYNADGVCYIKTNEPQMLYLDLWAEAVENGVHYYRYFTLKYPITKQEKEEFYNLNYPNFYYKFFVETGTSNPKCVGTPDSGIFIQALDKLRDPTVVSDSAIKTTRQAGDFALDYYKAVLTDEEFYGLGYVHSFNILTFDQSSQKSKLKFIVSDDPYTIDFRNGGQNAKIYYSTFNIYDNESSGIKWENNNVLDFKDHGAPTIKLYWRENHDQVEGSIDSCEDILVIRHSALHSKYIKEDINRNGDNEWAIIPNFDSFLKQRGQTLDSLKKDKEDNLAQ